MAKVLVNIDLSEGLADSVDVEVGGLEYTQTLDYVIFRLDVSNAMHGVMQ